MIRDTETETTSTLVSRSRQYQYYISTIANIYSSEVVKMISLAVSSSASFTSFMTGDSDSH